MKDDVGEAANTAHQKLTTAREVQNTQIDVTKDCRFDDILMGTGKCEKLKTHRKSTFPKPHSHVKYGLPKRRMVSKYGNKIKWCAPFLEYDKSVVIKLLMVCLILHCANVY
jgi:hypothetical protein